jgi:hypothetical protein
MCLADAHIAGWRGDIVGELFRRIAPQWIVRFASSTQVDEMQVKCFLPGT